MYFSTSSTYSRFHFRHGPGDPTQTLPGLVPPKKNPCEDEDGSKPFNTTVTWR